VVIHTEVSEYCQWEWFNASCTSPTDDRVILIQSARYGRMRYGRCVREDHGSLGCYADVLPQLSERCSGRRSCSVHVPDPSLHDAQSCPKELMPYLETSRDAQSCPKELMPYLETSRDAQPCPKELMPYLETSRDAQSCPKELMPYLKTSRDAQPCLKELMPYLETSYICVSGMNSTALSK